MMNVEFKIQNPKSKIILKDSSYIKRQDISSFKLQSDDERPLRFLDIELTERCNNNCVHCNINLPEDDAHAKAREMSTGEIKRILSNAARLGCLLVRFTGGEPLLREDFSELYLFTRRLGIRVIIFTNATLITPGLADLLERVPPLQRIEVSLYGIKPQTYEAVTRKTGSYKAAMAGIRLLREKGIRFVLKWVCLPQNIEDDDSVDGFVSSITGTDERVSRNAVFDLRCRWGDDQGKNRLIKDLRWQPEEVMRFQYHQDGGETDEQLIDFCRKFTGVRGDRLFSCEAGTTGGCMDAYGSFQPCLPLRHPECVYDLHHGSFEEALNDFFPQLRLKKATNPEFLKRCAKCFLRGLCDQCPAKSWMEHGTLDTPVDYLCDIAHVLAERIGLINSGEKGWNVSDWRERLEQGKCESEKV